MNMNYYVKLHITIALIILYHILITGTPKRKKFKSVIVNLYNIQFLFNDGTTLTVPLDKIKQGIRETEQILKNINRQELVDTQIKFMKYKGEYFKNLVQTNNIKQLIIMYCSMCGKSTLFKFKKDSIDVINKCDCGNTVIDITKMSYDEFAVWYASQTERNFKKNIDKQLFINEGK